ncbi:peroxidase [Citrus sinensis]|nr:peroxidase [Citrus sinensis]
MKDKGVAAGLWRMHFRDCFVRARRRDGRASKASEATTNLPSPAFNAKQLTQSFAAKGLTQEDMLIQFQWKPMCAVDLKRKCPKGNNNSNLVVPMNPASPSIKTTMSVTMLIFYATEGSLLQTKLCLLTQQHRIELKTIWGNKFAAAMVRMGPIGVVTGQAGEIRANCRVINSKNA